MMDEQNNNGLIFYVNGEKVTEVNPDPTCTLLQYLRKKLLLTGTKLVCGEGGCGACTVMLSKYDVIKDRIIHYSVNACLTPVCSVHGQAVTTTEGIGSLRTRLHPVQEQIAASHGSQCGFCTPGMVMSMYALLRNNPQPTMKDIEKHLEGNLCRCTGYRPILDGFRAFSNDQCSLGKNCCKNNTKDETDTDEVVKRSPLLYDSSQEPIFPPDLKINYNQYNTGKLFFEKNEVKWYRPVTLPELLQLKSQYSDAKMIVGNTEIGIEILIKNMKYPVLIHASHIPELTRVDSIDDGIKFGASVTLSRVVEVLEEAVENKPEENTRMFASVLEMLKWFAGKQIRNTASIGGNIMTASPISDLNPIFQACDATLEVMSQDKSIRKVPVDAHFFQGYRKTVVKSDEIVKSITLHFTKTNEYVKCYKQSLRKDDDIAIVNAGMRVVFKEQSDVIRNIFLSYGGMAPTTVMALKTMKQLSGRKWNTDLVPIACKYLEEDLPLSPDAPGGTIEYRKTLTTSFFFKFYLFVSQQLAKQGILHSANITANHISAIEPPDFGTITGSQVYEVIGADQKAENPVGRPIIHSSAYQQATGEAVYIDDMLPLEGELYMVPVYSSRAHAHIVNIDMSPALQVPGVIGLVDYSDVKGINYFTVIQEQFLAVDKVDSEGRLIGGIVATTKEIGKKARQSIKIEYKDLPSIITIQDAINNNSYLAPPLLENTGDVEQSFNKCDKVLEGEVYIGAQEHFYLETQSAIVVPKERGEVDVFSSTQNPFAVQTTVAEILGIAGNKVRCIVKRLGGGFGGKETQSIIEASLAATAAIKFNKPIRYVLDREDDMVMTGTRHPMLAKYKVGYSTDGRINSLDLNLYMNCGNSMDLSPHVLWVSMNKCDNCYKIDNFRITGHLCKTNIRSNTAFRGFGAPQGMMTTECVIQHIIDHEGFDQTRIRELNFYKEGDRTHTNHIIRECNIQDCWDECLRQSDYKNRIENVQEFNRNNRWRKRGISIVPLQFGIAFERMCMNQGGAFVNVYVDGSVLLAHGGVEMGQGLHVKMLQVASATLGISIDRINIIETGTNTVPNTSATAASTGSDLNGMAVKIACEKIVKRLEPFKAVEGSQWNDWILQAYENRVNLSVTGHYKTPGLGYDPATDSFNRFNYFSYGAGCSEVEIDCLTGDHIILRSDIVMDVGASINPAIDIGQIEGAFVQGCGLFMLEQYKMSPSGNLITRGPGTYKLPSVGNIPKIFNVAFLQGKPNGQAVCSSKAIGEPPLLLAVSVFLATKSAVKDARRENGVVGYFPFDSPATPDVIRIACQDEFTEQFCPPEEGTFRPWFVKRL